MTDDSQREVERLARQTALVIAASGASRDEAARYLAQNFDIDHEAVLDETYTVLDEIQRLPEERPGRRRAALADEPAPAIDPNAHPLWRRALLLERHPELADAQREFERVLQAAIAARFASFRVARDQGATVEEIALAVGIDEDDVRRVLDSPPRGA
jgi:hypothetical protein